jgi:PhnB protein
MNEVKIPEGYQQIMPYLILRNAAAFLEFTKKVFNAEEKVKHMRDEHTIMHAELKIGESVVMFADSTPEYNTSTAGLFIYVDDADAVFKKALDAGAKVIMELSDQPYGRSGGVADPFGNTWWITTEL